MEEQLTLFELEKEKIKQQKVVNVASVPHRSPFRYPGGKTWLIPVVRKWLKQGKIPEELCEPFAGGGIVGLTAAFEKLVHSVFMIELDEEVAAVWDVILNGDGEKFAKTIYSFDLTTENAIKILKKEYKSSEELAFSTIIKNRIFHGGIITRGSGFIKNGENGKGIKSRWYAKTLHDRIIAISHIKKRISFKQGDAFKILEAKINDENSFFFIDPPYTKAGKRLYTYYEIDHDNLFKLTSKLKGKFMLTYDDTTEIRGLAEKYKLDFRTIPMKTTHHIQKNELIISDNFNWWD
jgi:DNA adenine methylase